jgi:FAD dependent oxidoreductase
MAAGTLSRGLLASVMAAFSCFPTAREKPKPSAVKEGDFQCISCGMRKRNVTVICGGGVAGLSSAYWLGRMQKTQKQNIIVLEARNQCFQGASGYNSGLLSCHWFSGRLRQLADHSFGVYQDLARKQPSFKHTCDYHENSLFQAHCGEGPTDPRAPHWMNVTNGWHLESEPAMPTLQDKTHGSGFVQDDPSSATMYVCID